MTNSDNIAILAGSNDVPPGKSAASWKDSITGDDQEFKCANEFCGALQQYAIAHCRKLYLGVSFVEKLLHRSKSNIQYLLFSHVHNNIGKIYK